MSRLRALYQTPQTLSRTLSRATPTAAAALSLLGMAVAGGTWWLSITYRWPIVGDCWFRALTGLPCPGCGMGRACQALLLGDWAAAVAWHPLAPAFAAALAVSSGWLAADTVRGRSTYYPALHRATAGRQVRLALLTIIAAAWGWNLWRGEL